MADSGKVNGGYVPEEETVEMNGFKGTTPEDETTDGNSQTSEKAPAPNVGLLQLFRFADKKDKILMFFGTIAAIANGSATPLNLLIYGQVVDLFINDAIKDAQLNDTVGALPDDGESLSESINDLVWWFAVIGVCVMIVGYLEIAFWTWTAERQTNRVRRMAFSSILKQDIGWFDKHQTGELNTRLSDDIMKFNLGVGDKFGIFIQFMTTFIVGYTMGFIEGWKLTLVIMSVAPLMVIAVAMIAKMNQKYTVLEQAAYAKAGAVAEEVLSAIRTVTAFGGEKKESRRYDSNLVGAEAAGVKKGLITGICIGFVWMVIFSAFALSFWYGNKLVRNGELTGGTLLQVFMGVLIGTMSLGHAAPNMEHIANARGAAKSVFDLIDMESAIDSSSEEGERPKEVQGNITFKDISFRYPARPEVQVLDGFNLSVKVGQTVALVGPSGCGKSTTIQLLQRFYDPEAGSVLLDGRNIKDLNIKWLRQHIGVVSQEPILFAMSIADNIRLGRDGVSQQQVEQAAREANAHDFIKKLPQRYETLVGERGAQLSGGQKQRIAIARALVRNPKILLLDEATSALDNESEAIVQNALEKASEGRTTLVIAHRLSTIRNADLIVGISDGCVQEMGTHGDLMKKEGIYHSLVMSQTAARKTEIDDFEAQISITEPALLSKQISVSNPIFTRSLSTVSTGSVRDRKRTLSASSMGSKGYGRQASAMSQRAGEWTRKDEAKYADNLPPAPLKRIMRLNSPEWKYILGGCVAAIFTGIVHPSFSVVLSEIMGNFAEISLSEQERMASIYSLFMLGFGIIVGIAQFCQTYFMTVAGEGLTIRLRQMGFSSILRQNVGWFDDRSNQVGALTARLATDASIVRGAAGSQFGILIQSAMNICTALAIAFIFGWKLACVVVAFLPLLVAAGVAQGSLLQGFNKGDNKVIEEGGKIAVETIDNIRTVAALTKEDAFDEKYNAHFYKQYKKGVRKSHIYGLFYSIGQSVVFYAYAAAFSYGGELVEDGEMEFKNVIKVFSAITFGGQALGRAFTIAPDIGKAKVAAAKMFALFDRKPHIDSSSTDGLSPVGCDGTVEFHNVKFRYPSRRDVQVLQGLSITVKSGQTLALVGTSGCGKSTTIQLMERFYDPESGVMKIDGITTHNLNISWLRSQMGLVSQEPILFDASIRDNIAYGDNSREVTMEEIIQAARDSNIHNFIQDLPQGYDTNVGDKGTQLSGGQKQRVAIARALIRKPKILLLDEATSALDTESEHVVQSALDAARVGRTSIVIAHRLSTVQNSDIIAVIHNGVVVEQGNHSQLMAKQGYYYRLQKAQNRRTDSEVQ